MLLTIDVGNSRIKWAEWHSDKIVASGASVYDKNDLSANLEILFAGIKKPIAVYSVCVAAMAIRDTLTRWVQQRWQLEVDYLVTEKEHNNVIHGYTDPAEHGADRWAAIIAAAALYPGTSLCVIGAGTATTVDYLKCNGQHLGGYIFPSYSSMHMALTGDTASVGSALKGADFNDKGLADFERLASFDKLPVDTSNAVTYGLHRLLRAGIQGFCRQSEELFGGSVQVVVTGGFAETILCYPDMPKMHYVPNLVMQGLYIIKTTKP